MPSGLPLRGRFRENDWPLSMKTAGRFQRSQLTAFNDHVVRALGEALIEQINAKRFSAACGSAWKSDVEPASAAMRGRSGRTRRAGCWGHVARRGTAGVGDAAAAEPVTWRSCCASYVSMSARR